MALQHLRSSTVDKRPNPASMSDGQLAINTESTSPGVFFKNSGGSLVKVGPVHIGTTAPNAVPAGEAGNSAGEFWLDTTGGTAELKLYDGSGWATVGLPVAGGALTGDLTLNAQSDLRFADSDSSNWVAFQAPATIASNVTWTLPNADGTANQVLKTDGAGALSWTTITATTDKIEEGNTSAEVIDTGSDGHFKVLTEGTERARIDSSGRLLVGTSNSNAGEHKLQIEGNANSTASNGGIALRRGQTNPASNEWLGQISFTDAAGSEGAYITGEVDGSNWAASDYPTRLVFSTTADGASSPTERLRIQADGRLILFNTDLLYPNTDNAVGLGATNHRFSAVWAANGTIQTSDGREKTDVTNATLGIEFIQSLRPVSYKWIEGGKRDMGERDEDNNCIYESVPGTRTHWGFIAQEVKQAVDAAGVDFGGWVLTDKDDPDSQQALRYDQFIAPLTKALQEALAEIDALKAKVAALESA